MMMKYEHLFSKGKVGTLELKNRVVMTAMGIGLANLDGTASDEIIKYYEERAKGGVGLIVTEVTRVNDDHGVGGTRQLSVTKDIHIKPLRKLVDTVHQYGTKLFLQLHHPGRQTASALIGDQPVVAPSAIPCGVMQQETRELTTGEIESLVQDFVIGAKRAKAAGVDGIQLHAAHGYLITQFLSPYTNKRTDKYGGSFENRMRFLAEIILGIREECGDYPLTVRLTVDEFLSTIGVQEKGLELEEGVKIVQAIEKLGIDAIDVSSGNYETMNTVVEPTSYPQGWRTHLSQAIKDAVNIPVIAANVIRKPEFAEELLANNTIDFVGIGRGLLADPEWVNKVANGREAEIRNCISCLHCFESIFAGHVECAVNPRTARELEYDNLKQDGEGRRVAVIGAGPAGMESARILAMRGFKPVVFEKESEAGGQLLLANKPPQKEKITWLIDNMKNQLQALGVEIRYNTEATVAELKKLDPYAVFVGTGGTALVPPINGVENEHVYTTTEILEGSVELRDKVIAVIGSGLTGLETAEFLAEKGNTVTVVEMADKIAPGAYFQNVLDQLAKLNKLEVGLLPGHKLLKIEDDRIILEQVDNQEELILTVDAVILSLGVKPNTEIVEQLQNQFPNVKVIGDAKAPRKIAQAIREGFVEAYNLEVKEPALV
ncbi:NAD(P)/FAD-dependent oxidoreductase [Mesobacillus maritimus]|uniref:NAD(P)/FAD-dependent oxidoreductase n=1 Tax=Mesobacillus maritimus TaxID=1643336 RepID=UPI002041E3F8|nr:NAD(P)/FAD-dependent oxidoreductase [Mesobacillus maritimus]MCM3585586.1 NAD(P)/FAD-dependent oxidoreductase [Mesobacillus maritimus]